MSARVNRMLALIALLFLGAAADAEAKRRAFVVGNDDYAALTKLTSAEGDSRRVAQALELAGFQVIRTANGTLAQLDRDWARFLRNVGAGDFAVVYYAGHGVQKEGTNYLLPTDFTDTDPTLANAVRLDRWIGDLTAKNAAQKIVILDACRDNPLKTAARGLAAAQPPASGSGTYIVFATAPGRIATDGLFARHFVRELRRPGRRVEDVFNGTAAAIQKESGGGQVPFAVSSGGLAALYFSRPDRTEPLRLADEGKCTQAIPRLQLLATDDPDDGQVLAQLGFCQIKENDLANGRRNLERARPLVKLSPHLIDTGLALAAFNDKDFYEARERLGDALREEPNHPEALILRGRILLAEQQYAEAIELFDALMQRLQPDTPKARADLLTSCHLLADAYGLNGAVSLEKTMRSRCTAIASAP